MHRILMNGLKGSLIVLTAAVTFSVCWGVFTRYVLNSAADWTGEFSGYCLVWITFLGSAYAIFHRTHIRFESLIDAFPKPLKVAIETVFNMAMLFFAAVITYYGAKLAFNSMGDETLSLPVSKGVVYLILPIGGLLMFIGLFMEFVKPFVPSLATKKERVDQLEKVM